MIKKSILFLCLTSLSCSFLQAMDYYDPFDEPFELIKDSDDEQKPSDKNDEPPFKCNADGFVIIPDNLPNATASLAGANQRVKAFIQTRVWGDSKRPDAEKKATTLALCYDKLFSLTDDPQKEEQPNDSS